MCQIVIDQVDADTLQQATTLVAQVTGKCDHGGEVYMRVKWNNGQIGPETAAIQVGSEFSRLPVTYTAHNLFDRIEGLRVVLRCKATSVMQESEV